MMKTLNQKNKPNQQRSLEYYLNLQYAITLYPVSEGGYVAEIQDLPGCLTQGETLEEMIANIITKHENYGLRQLMKKVTQFLYQVMSYKSRYFDNETELRYYVYKRITGDLT